MLWGGTLNRGLPELSCPHSLCVVKPEVFQLSPQLLLCLPLSVHLHKSSCQSAGTSWQLCLRLQAPRAQPAAAHWATGNKCVSQHSEAFSILILLLLLYLIYILILYYYYILLYILLYPIELSLFQLINFTFCPILSPSDKRRRVSKHLCSV